MPYGMKYPSHDIVQNPGDEGACPPETKESINGMSYPNGDQSAPMVGTITLPSQGDQRNMGGSPSNDPSPAMPGA